MPARVTELSDAQRATFAPYVREWVERANKPGPLTDDDRAAVVEGIRACYEAAGRPWHGNVAWVGSPYTGERAAHAAAVKIYASRLPPPDEPPPPPKRRAVSEVLLSTVFSALIGLGSGAVLGALVGGTVAGTGAYIHVGGAAAIAGAVIVGVFSLVSVVAWLGDHEPTWFGVLLGLLGIAFFVVFGASIGAWFADERIPFPGSAIVATGRTWATVAALVGVVAAAALGLGLSLFTAPEVPVPAAPPPLRPPPDPTGDELHRAVTTAVISAVEAAVGDAVRTEVAEHVQRPIRAATGVLPGAVERLFADMAYGDLDDDYGEVPTHHAVDSVAARLAHGAPSAPAPVEVASSSQYTKKMPGNAAAELAAACWLRDHAGLELPDGLWSRADAYLAANRAGPWWPTADFVVVSEPPVERHLDADGLPHRAGAAALRWSDGLTGWFTHGEPEYKPGRPMSVGGSDF